MGYLTTGPSRLGNKRSGLRQTERLPHNQAMRCLTLLIFATLGCAGGPQGLGLGNGDGGALDVASDSMGLTGFGSVYTSGSRIRMKVIHSPDGAKQFWGWHDATRNEDCQILATSDGKQRCLPFVSSYLTIGSDFADAACTVPVVRIDANTSACGASIAKYIVVQSYSSCAFSFRIFDRGEIGSQTTLYRKSASNGSCTTSNLGQGETYRTFGAEIPASSFQEFTVETE